MDICCPPELYLGSPAWDLCTASCIAREMVDLKSDLPPPHTFPLPYWLSVVVVETIHVECKVFRPIIMEVLCEICLFGISDDGKRIAVCVCDHRFDISVNLVWCIVYVCVFMKCAHSWTSHAWSIWDCIDLERPELYTQISDISQKRSN